MRQTEHCVALLVLQLLTWEGNRLTIKILFYMPQLQIATSASASLSLPPRAHSNKLHCVYVCVSVCACSSSVCSKSERCRDWWLTSQTDWRQERGHRRVEGALRNERAADVFSLTQQHIKAHSQLSPCIVLVCVCIYIYIRSYIMAQRSVRPLEKINILF